jgi:hypothetical protein
LARRLKRFGKNVAGRFRDRFDDVTRRREALLARLENMPPHAQVHPAYANIRKLLGPSFIGSALAQRLAVLQSAEWLLNVLETVTFV